MTFTPSALVINNYNAQLFAGLGLTGSLPLLLLGIFNLLTVPGNLFNGLFIDRFGRRRFVMTGCIGIIICLSCEAAMTAVFVEDPANADNRIGLGFGVFLIFAFVVFYRYDEIKKVVTLLTVLAPASMRQCISFLVRYSQW